jgi:N-acetyl-1-D-myo-inositol-2-amino-2-deoxy-alpha-D-glucopyranoside deacetylase
MADPFGKSDRVVVFHAHPDDETLSTGAFLLERAGHGATAVVTATRGELGEIVPGSLPPGGDLVATREAEVRRATAILGAEHCFLGTSPASAGSTDHRYRDSGMVWVSPGVAGPAPNADASALVNAGFQEPAADLAAFCRSWDASALVSYADDGGYGHPDHVACHHIARLAATELGIGFWEIVSNPPSPPVEPPSALKTALACYRTQLTLDGNELVHVGGQRQPIATNVELRHCPFSR